MSFPSGFTESPDENKDEKNNPSNNYTLPSIDVSTLGLEFFEDARCSMCEKAPLGTILPELCLACQNQVVVERLEKENVEKEQRKRQIDEIRAQIDEVLIHSELYMALTDGNRKLKEGNKEIKEQAAESKAKTEKLRK
ncbi:hypothetical protein NHQ30_000833 [Ciborinia camelliae]|nr:hypothetical protein NHQ30_000833 [Ciborinia camelliae]